MSCSSCSQPVQNYGSGLTNSVNHTQNIQIARPSGFVIPNLAMPAPVTANQSQDKPKITR